MLFLWHLLNDLTELRGNSFYFFAVSRFCDEVNQKYYLMLISSVVSLIHFDRDVAVPRERLQRAVVLESQPGNAEQRDYLLDPHIAVDVVS